MNTREFDSAIARLENGFGIKLKREQANVWFEKLKGWTQRKVELVVDRALVDCDKFPALATLKRIGDALPMDATLAPREPCNFCDGRGTISASRVDSPEQRRPFFFVFRCPNCKNWEGRESTLIPIWKQEYRTRGYKPVLPHLEDVTKEDLEAMRELAPTIFNKFLESNPAWLDTFQPVDLTKKEYPSWEGNVPAAAESVSVEMLKQNIETMDHSPKPQINQVLTPGQFDAMATFIEASQPQEDDEWVPR